jgi:release factor glutamine methyltransferase
MSESSHGCQIQLKLTDGINKSDYYSDFLLEKVWVRIKKLGSKRKIHLLEIGTGRGYLSIILAKAFSRIVHIVATDIEWQAIRLARQNVELNGLAKRIEIRKGNLFEPVGDEKFDVILSVPPQIPISIDAVRKLIPSVPAYHMTTSVGGDDGREILDPLIQQAASHLNPGGFISFVHADFASPRKTLQQIENNNLTSRILGKRMKLLEETTLTRLSKDIIERTGYRFRKDENGKDMFDILVFSGTYEHH